jgi:division protein CdvB (Snf7/Vps24/ESCRT-III family)
MEIEIQIKNKVHQFFDWINRPVVQNFYIKDLQNWDALCASLHILNDLQRPKYEYYALESINHLEAIGIMQTIYIEQDSMQTLRNALLEIKYDGFKLNNYDEVRDTRNKVFGHPSDKKTGTIKTRHFFDIIDKNEQRIKHLYWGTIKEIDSEEFKINELVLKNSQVTLDYLQEIEKEFKEKFKEIMAKYTVQFDDIFKGANYTFEKLLTKDNDNVVIEPYEGTIDNEIEKVKTGLLERNLTEEFKREIEVLEFLSAKLKPLFYKQTYKDIEFYTYASTLIENIRKLEKELKNIDNL